MKKLILLLLVCCFCVPALAEDEVPAIANLDLFPLIGNSTRAEFIAAVGEPFFKGMTVEASSYKNDAPGDDIYLTLGLNGASYNFCVEVYLTGTESDVYTTVGTLNVGDVVNVEGFLYWYEGVNPHITAISVA